MVDALALLGEKARVDALLVERLDQLPLHLADRGDARTADPLLTIAFPRQPVATGGNGFRSSEPLSSPLHLPPIATDCDR
jgi:hypothetical protein